MLYGSAMWPMSEKLMQKMTVELNYLRRYLQITSYKKQQQMKYGKQWILLH
jgi:hypothetical protein